MGITDRLKGLTGRATKAAAEYKNQIHQAVEKAEALADQRTGGKYHDQLAGAGAKAGAYIDELKPAPPDKPETPPADAPEPPVTPVE